MELVLDMGPEGLQKVMIVSHERSGTHFLMNSLAQNYPYNSIGWIDLDVNMPVNFWHPDTVLEFMNALKGKPIVNIFKSHHQVEFFLPILSEMLEEFFIFYIYRSLTETMESFYKHLNEMEWQAGPKVESGEILADTAPSGGMLRYQFKQYRDCRERHYEHIEGWLHQVPLSLQNRIIYLTFEDLDHDFDRSIRHIGNRIGLVPPTNPVRPSKFQNVITPEMEAANGQGH